MGSVCLAVLNYNGMHHLEHLLPSALDAVRELSEPCPVILLDNQSPNGDAAKIRERFSWVDVIPAPENEYLFSYNWLLKQRREDIVILLNNDLRLTPGFIPPLLRHFTQNDVFSVSATSLGWDGREFTCGPARLHSHHGVYWWDYDRSRQTLSHTLFTSGGFMAVQREKFLKLNGFNRLYFPIYGEDLDLCFRAWKAGWRCIFEPASRVYHRESVSFGAKGNPRSVDFRTKRRAYPGGRALI